MIATPDEIYPGRVDSRTSLLFAIRGVARLGRSLDSCVFLLRDRSHPLALKWCDRIEGWRAAKAANRAMALVRRWTSQAQVQVQVERRFWVLAILVSASKK